MEPKLFLHMDTVCREMASHEVLKKEVLCRPGLSYAEEGMYLYLYHTGNNLPEDEASGAIISGTVKDSSS
jgi:hypothetical protein